MLHIDRVLPSGEPENQHHKNDEGTLCRHVIPEGESDERHVVQAVSKPVNKVRKYEPDNQGRNHQPLCLGPMGFTC